MNIILTFFKRLELQPSLGQFQGSIFLTFILGLRFLGVFQFLEWRSFDLFLRYRPPEATDERILLVGIDEKTIRQIGQYPIPDRNLAQLLSNIIQYQPRVIGLDLVRDLEHPPGSSDLQTLFKTTNALIGAKKGIEPVVDAPPAIPAERIGLMDAWIDPDDRQRRVLLGAQTTDGFQLSLSALIAQKYLQGEGIQLQNGIKDPRTFRFGEREIPRLTNNLGCYIRLKDVDGAIQTMLNPREGKQAFHFVTAQAVLNDAVDPMLIRDRIVLLGTATASIPDYSKIPATSVINTTNTWVYGLEVQGHAVSQIISAVLDDRPLMGSWSEVWDYIWILAWGLAGLSLASCAYSPCQNLWRWFGLSLSLLGICYVLFLVGLWVPFIPPFFALSLNSLVVKSCYEYQRKNQILLEARQCQIQILEASKVELENRVLKRTLELEIANQKLEKLANLDSLTEIANRRYFEQYLARQWLEHQSQKQGISVILTDIDYFKKYNDHYGHQQGDRCLYQVAQGIAQTLAGDPHFLTGRYGGEEFIVILPKTNEVEALSVAQKIQDTIENLSIPHERSSVNQHVTLSMGLSCVIPSSNFKQDTLIYQADLALYQAKHQGRNQVICYSQLLLN